MTIYSVDLTPFIEVVLDGAGAIVTVGGERVVSALSNKAVLTGVGLGLGAIALMEKVQRVAADYAREEEEEEEEISENSTPVAAARIAYVAKTPPPLAHQPSTPVAAPGAERERLTPPLSRERPHSSSLVSGGTDGESLPSDDARDVAVVASPFRELLAQQDGVPVEGDRVDGVDDALVAGSAVVRGEEERPALFRSSSPSPMLSLALPAARSVVSADGGRRGGGTVLTPFGLFRNRSILSLDDSGLGAITPDHIREKEKGAEITGGAREEVVIAPPALLVKEEEVKEDPIGERDVLSSHDQSFRSDFSDKSFQVIHPDTYAKIQSQFLVFNRKDDFETTMLKVCILVLRILSVGLLDLTLLIGSTIQDSVMLRERQEKALGQQESELL